MSGWEALGWLVFGCAVAIVLTVIHALWRRIVRPWIVRRWRHYQTRNTQPAQGQTWDQCGSQLRIEWVDAQGRVGVSHGGVRWSDSPERWRERVRNRRLYLVRRGRQPRGGMIP